MKFGIKIYPGAAYASPRYEPLYMINKPAMLPEPGKLDTNKWGLTTTSEIMSLDRSRVKYFKIRSC